jgi:hypothetical protein
MESPRLRARGTFTLEHSVSLWSVVFSTTEKEWTEKEWVFVQLMSFDGMQAYQWDMSPLYARFLWEELISKHSFKIVQS